MSTPNRFTSDTTAVLWLRVSLVLLMCQSNRVSHAAYQFSWPLVAQKHTITCPLLGLCCHGSLTTHVAGLARKMDSKSIKPLSQNSYNRTTVLPCCGKRAENVDSNSSLVALTYPPCDHGQYTSHASSTHGARLPGFAVLQTKPCFGRKLHADWLQF